VRPIAGSFGTTAPPPWHEASSTRFLGIDLSVIHWTGIAEIREHGLVI
jgi:hypothetical protein